MYLTYIALQFKQEMTSREYLDDQDAEEPDDFIISLTAQVSKFSCSFFRASSGQYHIVGPAKGMFIYISTCQRVVIAFLFSYLKF